MFGYLIYYKVNLSWWLWLKHPQWAPNARVTRTCCYAWLLHSCWGSKLRSFCFYGKHVAHSAVFPALKCLFLFVLRILYMHIMYFEQIHPIPSLPNSFPICHLLFCPLFFLSDPLTCFLRKKWNNMSSQLHYITIFINKYLLSTEHMYTKNISLTRGSCFWGISTLIGKTNSMITWLGGGEYKLPSQEIQ